MNTHSFSRRMMHKLLPVAASLALLANSLPFSFGAAQAQAVAQGVGITDVDAINACLSAPTAAPGTRISHSLVQRSSGQDWLQFSVTKGQRYRIEGADQAQMLLMAGCTAQSAAQPVVGDKFEFTAHQDATYYVNIGAQRDSTGQRSNTLSYNFQLDNLGAQEQQRIPLADVPVNFQRQALDFIESMAGGDLAPNWKNAQLAATVAVLYRPDITGPAYYDFGVETPGANGLEAAGFVMLSTGTHDYPITAWDSEGTSPSAELETLGANQEKETTKLFKIDALTYAAEYETPSPTGISISVAATDVVMLGTLPMKLVGLANLDVSQETELSGTNFQTANPTSDDSDPSKLQGEATSFGPQEASLDEEKWASWAELKEEFAATYQPLLDHLAQNASPNWQNLDNTKTYGEPLIKGDERTIQALATISATEIVLSGEGAAAQYTQQELLSENGSPTGVHITILDTLPDVTQYLPLTVTIRYANGDSESKGFALVSGFFNNQIYLPLVSAGNNNNNVSAATVEQSTAIQGSWGPWNYWWAGNDGDQRVYDQFQSGVTPNNSGCWSGCGATAWAMLFGWADHQAAIGNSRWTPRNGIYRQDGGFGFDADAPRSMDQGVRNMTWEIRNDIGTWCGTDGGGWTSASEMWKAAWYFNGRTGTRLYDTYQRSGVSMDSVRNLAINAIKGGTPAVIGVNSHFPLAWGYAEQVYTDRSCFLWWCNTSYSYNQWFWVNQGWGGAGNDWVRADTWYAGSIAP